MVEITLPMNL